LRERTTKRTAWPVGSDAEARGGLQVGIVVANFNTRRLIAQLVFSLHRLLGRSEFAQIVIVDNASTDGSSQLLHALHDARLIHLIRNRSQRYHGPALTQGISWLARRQRTLPADERLDYVWVIDSDVIVLRSDTVRDALRLFEQSGAAAVGQKMGDPAYDALLQHNPEMLDPCSLMLKPARIWQDPIPPFVEDGAPSTALQVAADAQGLRLAAFPFIEDGYLLHLGRGTLREVADRKDTTNRYYKWAVDHRDYHFAGKADGAELLASFTNLFETEVDDLDADQLTAACLLPDILGLGKRQSSG
jgi:hypothetical protein